MYEITQKHNKNTVAFVSIKAPEKDDFSDVLYLWCWCGNNNNIFPFKKWAGSKRQKKKTKAGIKTVSLER